MGGSRKFCQRVSNFAKISFYYLFIFDERREDPNTTKKRAIIGSPSKLRFAGRPLWLYIECNWLHSVVIFQGILTSIAKIPYIFVIFQGGPDPLSPPPSLDPRMCVFSKI